MSLLNKKIYVAGHNGMVGSACVRELNRKGFKNLIFSSSSELNLRNQHDVYKFISRKKPDIIIDAAARVGGIEANRKFPYEFLIENLQIQNNLINTAFELNIDKFIFLGSSCIYPKFSKQPIKEEYLLQSQLEKTNESYAIAKIAGVKLIESLNKQYKKKYISLMPTNLYGPYDNFDVNTSHVLPAMIKKFYDAKINKKSNSVVLWGTGKVYREFLHVDDLASAIIFCVENELKDNLYNVGYGKDISIYDLAKLIQNIVNKDCKIIWDNSMPDGTPKKLMDSSKFNNLGWSPKIDLESGIKSTYEWFLNNIDNLKQLKINNEL